MSRALDFQIRYGNADELDNYDPMSDVYNNQTFIGGTQHLIFNRPSYDTTTRQTILTDEIGDDDPNRLIVSNRCLLGDGVSTIDVKGALTGSVTAKAYTTTSGVGGWALNNLTLSGGVLTLASGTYYKTIERYVNGVLYDHVPLEDAPSGFDGANTLTTKGESLTFTSSNYTANRTIREDIPWGASFGDRYGYSEDIISFNSQDYDVNDFTVVQSAGNVDLYRDTLKDNEFSYPVALSGGIPITLSGEQAGLRENYILLLTDGQSPALNRILINKEFSNAQYSLNFQVSNNALFGISLYDTYLHSTLNTLLPTLSDPLGDLQRIAPFNYYSLDSIMAWWDNNPSLRFNIDNLLNQYVTGLTYETFYDYYASQGVGTSSFDTYDGLILVFYQEYSSGTYDISGDGFIDNGQSVGGGNTLTGRIYWYSNNIELNIITTNSFSISRVSGTSIESVKIYGDFIKEIPILPVDEDNKTIDAVNNQTLTYGGKMQFNAFRLNNKAAYFDTGSALIPASGTISGYAIDETWGSATFAMSGNSIACTASGSCNGIKLNNGNWYTFSEGIFGDASDYVYDVSGSGVHLQISGQTAADTWQQATGQTDLGYDWRNLYGGHRYRLVDAADDIFIPHVVNTQDVPTESLLPSGYTLLTDITAGKYVYNNSTWLLASGQVSEYRSELDAHEMNVTAFTESYGHYIRNQSTRWDRIVIYPNNLSEAANTLVDFNAGDIESIVGITYKVTDIHDLNQINASYSKKFRLPATQRNNDLFDYVYDPNSSDFESLKEPKDCEIISNGIEILRGKGQVEATYKKDIATAYDMSVIGDNYNVYTALDDIMVSGLDLGTFTISQANVEASWNYTAASGNVVFAPIDWGNKNYNSFDIADITPSLFIRNILQKGFASAGIGYESAWLDGDYAGRLVTPFNGFWTLSDADYATISGYAYFNAEDASYGVTASGIGNKAYLEITEVTSNPNYAPATGYLAADAAKMKFTLAFDDLTYDNANIQALAAGTVGAALFGCTFGIEINGQDVIEKTIGAESLSISTSNIQIIGGDIVRVYMKGAEDVNLTNVSFKSEVKRDIAQDITITLNQYTPVYKDGLSVFDIFKGLADVFNLIAYYDPYSKLLKFEPYNTFYSGELDWSDKWNQTLEAKNFYLGNQLNREILHKYKDDDTDYWLERFDKGNEDREPYASYLLELPRNYTKGRRVVENHLFAPTTDYEFSQFGVTIPNIRWNTKDGSQFSGGRSGQIPQPRILYFEGKNNSGTFKMNVGSGFQYSVQEYEYFPRLAFRARSGESWQSLAMDTYDSKNGAFRTYFEPKYRNIWSGITSIYWLNLTEKDIALRPLDKKIYLDGAWWLINQIIDFNPLNDDPTQVELIKLVNYTFNIPPNKTPWIDIVTGKKFDPVSHKPNNDLPSNGGFDVTTTSGYVISPVDDDYYGVSFGQNNLAPNKANSVMFGSDLNTYWSDQFIVGQFNSPNQNAIFQVGGGTSASGRKNAFEVEKSGGEFVAKVGGDRIVSDAWHMTTSGVKRSSYKQLTGSGTLAGDGTLTIYPTHDATSSGTALFNEITFASAMVTNLNGGGGSSDLHFNTLTTTQIDIYATSAHGYDIIYKIEGN